jgi:hypothetical protein
MTKKTWIIIGIAVLLIVVVAGIILLKSPPTPVPQPINESSIITPSQAYSICTDKSCPTEPVYIQGDMSRSSTTFGMFVLSDGKKAVYVDLRSANLSLIDTILFHEKTFLQKNGIVEVRLKGIISHDVGMCTMNSCQDMVNMVINPKQVEVIKKVGCKDVKSGKTSLEDGDCFDVSYRKISLADAYNTFFSSKICTQEGRRPSGSFEYNSDENKWVFGVYSNSRPGGCSESCEVYADKVVFNRQCAFGSSATVPENVVTKPLDALYSDCKKSAAVTYKPLGLAKDEPVGATRKDANGYTWTKQTDDTWKILTNVPQGYEGTSWGDALIDEQPGGVNYKPDLIECDVYLKNTLK